MRIIGLCGAGLLCVVAFAPISVHAQAPESVYTELLEGRCKFISIDAETNEEQVKRCPGHGGATVLTRASQK